MNRDYIITYYELDSDKVDQKRFHTLKQLSDWMNSDDTAVAITSIDEVPGLSINEARRLTVAEIAEELNLDKVEVRPMKEAENGKA